MTGTDALSEAWRQRVFRTVSVDRVTSLDLPTEDIPENIVATRVAVTWTYGGTTVVWCHTALEGARAILLGDTTGVFVEVDN